MHKLEEVVVHLTDRVERGEKTTSMLLNRMKDLTAINDAQTTALETLARFVFSDSGLVRPGGQGVARAHAILLNNNDGRLSLLRRWR